MNDSALGGSVTCWIGPMKIGDHEAAQALWQRYFNGLIRLARNRLRDSPRAAADEEDVALSAFHCFWRGAAGGRFTQLANRDDLWRLLATIAAQKAVDQQRHAGRAKRNGHPVAADPAGRASGAEFLAQVAGREPSPELAAVLQDQYRHLVERLEDDSLRQIAGWKMEGESNEEIARRLRCGLRTVERKLGVIRAIWLADEPN